MDKNQQETQEKGLVFTDCS